MDAKDRLYSAATQQFDECLEKYAQKIKNCLYGMIFHAYNEGKRDGQKAHDEQAYNIGAEEMLDAIRHFSLSQKVLPTSFTTEEIESVFPDCSAVDLLTQDAKEILHEAETIRENRNVDTFLEKEKLKECDTVEYALDVLRKHGWKDSSETDDLFGESQVVKCKDCIFNMPVGKKYICVKADHNNSIQHDPEWFCADGEKGM